MTEIDFGELRTMDLPGTALENLARLMFPMVYPGCELDFSGVGPDDGKDLKIVVKNDDGSQFAWLVQCKNYPQGNVTPGEVTDIVDRIFMHNCDGFRLMTTGNLSVGTKNLIDGLNGRDIGGKIIRADYWDKAILLEKLVRPEFRGIVIVFFPESAKRLSAGDVLSSVSLLNAIQHLSWRDAEAAIKMALSIIEQSNNAVIARSMAEFACSELSLTNEDLYELAFELTVYGNQKFEDTAFCQQLTEFLSGNEIVELDTIVANGVNDRARLEEAYATAIEIQRTSSDDLVFESEVHVSTDFATSVSVTVKGELESDGFHLTDVQSQGVLDDEDDQSYLAAEFDANNHNHDAEDTEKSDSERLPKKKAKDQLK